MVIKQGLAICNKSNNFLERILLLKKICLVGLSFLGLFVINRYFPS